MNSKILLFLRAVLLLLSIGMMSGCEEKDATIDVNYPNYLAIVEDIGGNQNGVSASAEQINSLIEVDGARENLDYSIGLILMGEYKHLYNIAAGEDKERYNISCVNTERPTPEEIQNAVNAVNLSADILIQIGNEADDTATESVVTIEQIRRIIPPVRNILENAVDLYRAYIDKYPDRFSSPATQPEVQAMIDAVNSGIDPAGSTVEADPTIVIADGEHFSTITVTVKSVRGVLLIDANVLLDQNGTSSIGEVENNNDGSYEFTVTSDTVQSVAYEAIVNGIRVDASAEVNFTYDPNPDNWVVSLTPSTQDVIASAQRVIRGMIVAEVKDGVGHPVTGATGENMISLDQGNQVSHIYASENRGNGRYEIEVSSEVVSDVIYVAKVGEALHNESTAIVRFTHDPDPSHWNILLSPAEQGVTISTPANESHGTVAIEVKDNEGNLVSGVSSRLALIGTNSQTSTIGQVSGDNGVYYASVSSDARKTVVYQAKIDAVLHNESSATVNYVTSINPEDWDISLVANPAINLKADGETKSTITAMVTVRGTNESVELADLHISGGEPSTHSAVDFSDKDNGIYTFTVTSEEPGDVEYHVDAYNQAYPDGNTTDSKDVSIKFVRDMDPNNWILTFTANPATVKANGEMSILRGVLNHKLGYPINDANITIAQNGQSDIGDGKLVNSNGGNIYTLEVNSTQVENVIYGASTIYNNETVDLNATNVNFTSVGITVSIVAAEHNVTVSEMQGTTITVTVKDSSGNLIDPDAIELTDENNIARISVPNRESLGTYVFAVGSTKAEDVNYTATATKDANSGTASTIVNYIPAAMSPNNSTLTAEPDENVTADGVDSSTLLLTLKDRFDNLISDAENVIAKMEDNSTAIPGEFVNQGNGTYTKSVTSTVDGVIIYEAYSGNPSVRITDTASVGYIPGSIDPNGLSITGPSELGVPNVTGTLAVEVKDAQGNKIAGLCPSITMANNGSDIIVASCVETAERVYNFVVSSSSTVEQSVVFSVAVNQNGNAATGEHTVLFKPSDIALLALSISPNSTEVSDGAGSGILLTTTLKDSSGVGLDGQAAVITLEHNLTAPFTLCNVWTGIGNGEYTCKVTSEVAGVFAFKTSANSVDSNVTEATFIHGDVDASHSNMLANPSEVILNPPSPHATIEITLVDSFGNSITDIPLADVLMSIHAEQQPASQSNARIEGDKYMIDVNTSKAPQTITYTTVANAIAIDTNASVVYNPGAVDPDVSTVVSDKTEILADGAEEATITVTLMDAFENLVNAAVESSCKIGVNEMQTSSPLEHPSKGVYIFTVGSKDTAGVVQRGLMTCTVTANGNLVLNDKPEIQVGTTGDPEVTITATPSTNVEVSECANGGSDITVTVTDGASPITDSNVTLTDNGQDSEIGDQVDNGNGVYTYHVCSTKAEDVNYTATATKDANSGTASTIVNYIPAAMSPNNSTLTAEPDENVTADGVDSSTLLLTLKDRFDNLISDAENVIAKMEDNSTAIPGEFVNQGNGTYTKSVTSTVDGVIIYEAYSGNPSVRITDTASVGYIPGDIDNVTIDGPGIVSIPSSEGTLAVTVKDAQGNPIPDLCPNITMEHNGSNTITVVNCNETAEGVYDFVISKSDTLNQTVLFSATASKDGHSASAEHTVDFQQIPLAGITLSISPDSTEVSDGNGNGVILTTRLFADPGNIGLDGLEGAINLEHNLTAPFTKCDAWTGIGNGEYTCKVTSEVAGVFGFKTSANSVDSNVIEATFTHGDVDASRSNMLANPSEVILNPPSPHSTIEITLVDSFGNSITDIPLADVVMSIHAEQEPASQSNARIEGDKYMIDVNTSKAPQTITYTTVANAIAIDTNASVVYNPGAVDPDVSTVVSDKTEILADGAEEATITVTLMDAFENLVNAAVESSCKIGVNEMQTSSPLEHPSKGVYIFTVGSKDTAGVVQRGLMTCTVTANGNLVLNDKPEIQVGNPDTIQVQITASPSTDVEVSECANGGGSDITVTVTDGASLITDSNVTLTDNGQDSEIGDQVDNGNGVYTYHVCSKKAEEVTYTATATKGTNSDTQTTVVGYAPTVNPSTWIITLSPVTQDVTVGTDGNISVSVKDIYGNEINGTTISLQADIGSSEHVPCDTNAQGECTITVSDTVVEKIVYSPRADGNETHATSNTATVNFLYGAVGEVTITTDKADVMAIEGEFATLTVAVKDVENNLMEDVTVTLADNPQGTSDITDTVNNLDGTYTIEVNSTTLGEVTYTAIVDGNVSDASVAVTFVLGTVDLSQSSIKVYEDFNLIDPTDYGTEVNESVPSGKILRAIITLKDAANHSVDNSDKSDYLALAFNADPDLGLAGVEYSTAGVMTSIDNARYYQDFKVLKISNNTMGATYNGDSITENEVPELRDVNITFGAVDKNMSESSCVTTIDYLDGNVTVYGENTTNYTCINSRVIGTDNTDIKKMTWSMHNVYKDAHGNPVIVNEEDFQVDFTWGSLSTPLELGGDQRSLIGRIPYTEIDGGLNLQLTLGDGENHAFNFQVTNSVQGDNVYDIEVGFNNMEMFDPVVQPYNKPDVEDALVLYMQLYVKGTEFTLENENPIYEY